MKQNLYATAMVRKFKSTCYIHISLSNYENWMIFPSKVKFIELSFCYNWFHSKILSFKGATIKNKNVVQYVQQRQIHTCMFRWPYLSKEWLDLSDLHLICYLYGLALEVCKLLFELCTIFLQNLFECLKHLKNLWNSVRLVYTHLITVDNILVKFVFLEDVQKWSFCGL